MNEPIHPRDIKPRLRDYWKVFVIAALLGLIPGVPIIGFQWWKFGLPSTLGLAAAQLITYLGCIVVVLIVLACMRPGKGLSADFGG